MRNTCKTAIKDYKIDSSTSPKAWENRRCLFSHCPHHPNPMDAVIYYTVNTWEMVLQHRRINNRSAPGTSRESWSSFSARLLWEFSNYRETYEVSHACCCGVCPSRSLSPSLLHPHLLLQPSVAAIRRLPLFFLSLLLCSSPTPFLSVSLALHLPVCFCCLGGLLHSWGERKKGYREYWSFGESLWKMAPVVTGWVWISGLVVWSRVVCWLIQLGEQKKQVKSLSHVPDAVYTPLFSTTGFGHQQPFSLSPFQACLRASVVSFARLLTVVTAAPAAVFCGASAG